MSCIWTTDLPCRLVITSSDGSFIESIQTNSSHQISHILKTKVNISIESISDGVGLKRRENSFDLKDNENFVMRNDSANHTSSWGRASSCDQTVFNGQVKPANYSDLISRFEVRDCYAGLQFLSENDHGPGGEINSDSISSNFSDERYKTSNGNNLTEPKYSKQVFHCNSSKCFTGEEINLTDDPKDQFTTIKLPRENLRQSRLPLMDVDSDNLEIDVDKTASISCNDDESCGGFDSDSIENKGEDESDDDEKGERKKKKKADETSLLQQPTIQPQAETNKILLRQQSQVGRKVNKFHERFYKGIGYFIYKISSGETVDNAGIRRKLQEHFICKKIDRKSHYFCKFHQNCKFRARGKSSLRDHLFSYFFYIKCPLCNLHCKYTANFYRHLNKCCLTQS